MLYEDCGPQTIMFTHKPLSIIQGSVPLLLGLVTYCTLAHAFGGLSFSGLEIRHGRRVSVESVEADGG